MLLLLAKRSTQGGVRTLSSSAAAAMFEFKPKQTQKEKAPLLSNEEFAKKVQETKQAAAAKFLNMTEEVLNQKLMKCDKMSKLAFVFETIPNKDLTPINASTTMLKTGVLHAKTKETVTPQHLEKLLAVLRLNENKFNNRSMLSVCWGAYQLKDSQCLAFANHLLATKYKPTPYVPHPRNNPFSHPKGSPDDEQNESTKVMEVFRVVEMLAHLLPNNHELRNTMVDDYLCRLKLKKISSKEICHIGALVVQLGPEYGEANGRNAYLRSLKVELFKRKYRGLDAEDWDKLFATMKQAGIDCDDIFDYFALVISTGHKSVEPEFLEKLLQHLSPAKLEEINSAQ